MYFKNIYKTLEQLTGTEQDKSQKTSINGPLGSINIKFIFLFHPDNFVVSWFHPIQEACFTKRA